MSKFRKHAVPIPQFLCLIFLISCASAPVVQPQVNSLVVAERFDHALDVLKEHEQSYGEKNRLLYLLDYGLVLHLSGNYGQSIEKFEEAKKLYDDLYTISLRDEFKTWLINDYYAPYRGEDFERVLINVFQSLNFLKLKNIDEALVDARNVDEVLSMINRQYKPHEQNKYNEDAFARFLMGILYEHSATFEGYNDAFISYTKAVEIYEKNYLPDYDIDVPKILKENMLATAEFMGSDELAKYRDKFRGTQYVSLKKKEEIAEVYLFYYYGFSPIKHQVSIPIPLPNGFMTQLAFPRYDKRRVKCEPVQFKAVNEESQTIMEKKTEVAEDIAAIAFQNLDNRRARVLAKAALRSGGKVIIEDQLEQRINGRFGSTGGDVFRYVASLYNLSSEQADLRSWQTLPGEIRIARLWLKPGRYSFYADERFLGRLDLQAGDKEYFIVRTTR